MPLDADILVTKIYMTRGSQNVTILMPRRKAMTTPLFAAARANAFSPAADWLEQELFVPHEGQTRMRLVFAKGVSDLSLRIGETEAALIRGHFDGLVPNVSVASDEVSIRYPRFGIADW